MINITSIFVKVLSSSSESSSALLNSSRTKAWNKDTINSFLPCNTTKAKCKLQHFKLIPLYKKCYSAETNHLHSNNLNNTHIQNTYFMHSLHEVNRLWLVWKPNLRQEINARLYANSQIMFIGTCQCLRAGRLEAKRHRVQNNSQLEMFIHYC